MTENYTKTVDGVTSPMTPDEIAALIASQPVLTPSDCPLTRRQLRLGLIRHGVPLETVQAAIDGIEDELQRAEAQIYWEDTAIIRWDHPMTQALLALTSITPEQAEAMWMAAKDYEA